MPSSILLHIQRYVKLFFALFPRFLRTIFADYTSSIIRMESQQPNSSTDIQWLS